MSLIIFCIELINIQNITTDSMKHVISIPKPVIFRWITISNPIHPITHSIDLSLPIELEGQVWSAFKTRQTRCITVHPSTISGIDEGHTMLFNCEILPSETFYFNCRAFLNIPRMVLRFSWALHTTNLQPNSWPRSQITMIAPVWYCRKKNRKRNARQRSFSKSQ